MSGRFECREGLELAIRELVKTGISREVISKVLAEIAKDVLDKNFFDLDYLK